MNLLRGPGFKGQQKGGKYSFHWNDWNLPFVPSKSTRNKEKAGYMTKSGIMKSLLITFLLIAQLEESNVVPLVDLPSLRAIPVRYRWNCYQTGSTVWYMREESCRTSFPSRSGLCQNESVPRSQFTEVNCENVTSLDNRLSLPVGLEYSGKCVSGDDKADTINKQIKQLQICL